MSHKCCSCLNVTDCLIFSLLRLWPPVSPFAWSPLFCCLLAMPVYFFRRHRHRHIRALSVHLKARDAEMGNFEWFRPWLMLVGETFRFRLRVSVLTAVPLPPGEMTIDQAPGDAVSRFWDSGKFEMAPAPTLDPRKHRRS